MATNLLAFTERGAGTPLLLVHGLMISGEMFAYSNVPCVVSTTSLRLRSS